jgi:uncharacterized membrane protein YtjA (UPF0391 family)
MLNWAVTFLIVALVAALLGFTGVAGQAAWMAQVLFIVFLVLFLVSLVAGPRVRVWPFVADLARDWAVFDSHPKSGDFGYQEFDV